MAGDKNKISLEVEAAEVLWPATWKRLYQRHIEAPGGHYGFKTAVACMTNAMEGYTHGIQTHATSAITCAASVLHDYKMPVYFVGRELLAAVKNTNPPASMTWDQIKKPQMAALYMLPVWGLREVQAPATEAEVLFIGYAWMEEGKEYQVPGYAHYRLAAGVNKLVVFWATFDGEKMAACDCTIAGGQELAPGQDWISGQTAIYREKQAEEGSRLLDSWDLESNPQFSSYLCGLLANLMLIQTARPELVEMGQATGKRIKSYGGLACYTPNFIGRKYTVRKEAGTGAGAGNQDLGGRFTELRWRAGHYRMQHYGAGRVEVKTIWIEPYLAYAAGLVRGG